MLVRRLRPGPGDTGAGEGEGIPACLSLAERGLLVLLGKYYSRKTLKHQEISWTLGLVVLFIVNGLPRGVRARPCPSGRPWRCWEPGHSGPLLCPGSKCRVFIEYLGHSGNEGQVKLKGLLVYMPTGIFPSL